MLSPNDGLGTFPRRKSRHVWLESTALNFVPFMKDVRQIQIIPLMSLDIRQMASSLRAPKAPDTKTPICRQSVPVTQQQNFFKLPSRQDHKTTNYLSIRYKLTCLVTNSTSCRRYLLRIRAWSTILQTSFQLFQRFSWTRILCRWIELLVLTT